MIKKVNLGNNQSIELNGSVGWLLLYREQFGHDILPDLMPMLEGSLDAMVKAFNKEDQEDEEDKKDPKSTAKDLVARIDDDILLDIWTSLSGFELTTLLQIVWAMAKKADPEIAPVEDYFDQFDSISIDKLAPAVFRTIVESTVSSKNARSLLKMIDQIRRINLSASKTSSSQALKEA